MRRIDLRKLLGGLLLLIPHPRKPHNDLYLQRYAALFPHIRLDRLRSGDMIRIPLQLLWLALVRTTPRPVFPLRKWKQHDWPRLVKFGHGVAGKAASGAEWCADQFHARTGPVVERLRRAGEEYAKHRCWDYPIIRYLACGVSALLTFPCITILFDAPDQLMFAVMLLAIAFAARIVSGQTAVLLLAGLSLVASLRYFWWRASSTLNMDGNIDLAWSSMLFAAEFSVWLIFLVGCFKALVPAKCLPVEPSTQTGRWSSLGILIQPCGPLNGIARIVLLAAPLAFLLFHIDVIYAPPALLALYALPHLAHAMMASKLIKRGDHPSFPVTAYKTAFSWCMIRRITAVLAHPRTFSATSNSARKDSPDSTLLALLLMLAIFNLAGLVAGLGRLYSNPHDGEGMTWIYLVWAFYNLLFLGAAITIILELEKTGIARLSEYGLREVLSMCFMGYCRSGRQLLFYLSPVTRYFSRLGTTVKTYLPRSPALSSE